MIGLVWLTPSIIVGWMTNLFDIYNSISSFIMAIVDSFGVYFVILGFERKLSVHLVKGWHLTKTREFEILFLNSFCSYYDQLCALETKIPAHELQVPFKWKDAFDKGSLFGGSISLSMFDDIDNIYDSSFKFKQIGGALSIASWRSGSTKVMISK